MSRRNFFGGMQLHLLYLWRNLFFSKQLRVQWSSNRATRCAGIGGALGVPWRTCHTDKTSPFTARAARSVRAAAFRQVATVDPPRGCTTPAPRSDGGQPCGRTWEEKRHHRSLVPRDAMPTRRSSFRLLVMASPYWMIYVRY